MSKPHPGGAARRRTLGALSAGVLAAGLVATLSPGQAAQAADEAGGLRELGPGAADLRSTATFEDGRYIVLLTQPSIAAYDGGTQGLAPTRAVPGESLRTTTSAFGDYRSFLARQQRSTAAAVGAKVVRSYTVATNGFASELTAEQAAELSADKAVYAVVPVEARSIDARDNTASFLGMYGKGGVWKQHGGSQADAGSGIVVGDLDTGIWPENPSFSGDPLSSAPTGEWGATVDPLGNTTMRKSDGGTFRGACETGEEFTVADCSTKLIGARAYPDSFVSTVPEDEYSPAEFLSPRDGGGHGSHTASTAAGNVVKDVTVDGIDFGEVTGMVPGASIASYKVCWEDTDPDTGGCYTDAILSAIDDAVRDGVDVINFSISGALDTVVDPVEIAFAGAADASVFVAASAGNSGPTASTVAHNSPWLTTVASSTYRNFEGTVELGDGSTYLGAMVDREGLPEQTPLVDAADSAAAGADPGDAALCGPDTLDDAAVDGSVVLCLRGTYDRVAKSAEVERAGGVAMVLVNPGAGSLDADLHTVPTVHLPDTALDDVSAYLDSTDAPTAALLPGNESEEASAPLPAVSGFSSRGPALANDSDILKPDITAPGQSVLAAVAPPSNSDRDFDLYSGTSMAAPHIAGLGALLMAENPTWTPQMVQSAMMTTATSTRTATDKASRDAFAQGAGQVTPADMFSPGLFVTSTPKQWYGLITEQGYDTGVESRSARTVNLPSMADHAVVGSTTFTRRVTSQVAGTWKVRGKVPGFDVRAVTPTVTAARAGVKRKVTIEFTAKPGTTLETWRKGYVTLTGPTRVRMPVALRPTALSAPDVVTGTGTTGSTDVTITSGSTGEIDLTAVGLTPAQSVENAVPQGSAQGYCVPVTAGSELLRVDLDTADDTADLDLYAIPTDAECTAATGPEVAAATGSADETLSIEEPTAAAYVLQVDGYAAGDAGSPIDYRLDAYDLGAATSEGDFTVDPDPLPVTQGEESTYTASWTDLATDGRYLGLVRYGDTGLSTAVEVSTLGEE
ncbi:S8 family serine peptidase [Nocardioides sp. AX2bis]|uniref:S8 family serine peptidase n=1 Tax=Nocardioides sp. AX2bis TaxID=2653157 RepID=UPI001358870E|nr:S8 family serine peptidase [Nocardioides sp. AX2bis]